jgi:hypothetical protein
MSRMRNSLVIALALLLAAATAAGDTVVTANEVIDCLVVWSDTNFTRLKLPSGGVRMLYTRDIREIRLSDPSRTIEPPPRPPQVTPSPDSARPVPPPSVDDTDLPGYAGILDTLARGASQSAIAAKCRQVDKALCALGQSDSSVLKLLGEVRREQEALRGIWPMWQRVLCAEAIGVPIGCAGFLVGQAIEPMGGYLEYGPGGPGDCVVDCGGGPVGMLLGVLVGTIAGRVAGNTWRAAIVARHRVLVNDLVRRANRAFASQP